MAFRSFIVPVIYLVDTTKGLSKLITSHRFELSERKCIKVGTQSAWYLCLEPRVVCGLLDSRLELENFKAYKAMLNA